MKCVNMVGTEINHSTQIAVLPRDMDVHWFITGQLTPSAESDRSGFGVSARLPTILDQYGFTQKDMGFSIGIKKNVCGLAEGRSANKSAKETVRIQGFCAVDH